MTAKQVKWSYPDVRIGVDKGNLRLQFSTRVSQSYFGRKQYYRGLGRADSDDNYKWATRICARIQSDLDHPDTEKLFDPTLQKYLGKILLNLPSAKSVPTLGNNFLDYSARLFKLGKIRESTYKSLYLKNYAGLIKQWKDEPISRDLAETIIQAFNESPKNREQKSRVVSVLTKICDWLIDKDELTKNPFKGLEDSIVVTKQKKNHQASLGEEDYRSFTQEERDIIIRAFYKSHKEAESSIAPLIEFLFLTGCRPCEAFPLVWSDINFEKKIIVFSKSYESTSKSLSYDKTKTGTIRVFPFYPKLEAFLFKHYTKTYRNNNKLLFTNNKHEHFKRFNLSNAWFKRNGNSKGRTYYYDGVVTRLANEGKINHYLKPYATRHTFITLQILGALNDPNDKTNFIGKIKFIADIVGNSVETIQKYYLDKPRDGYVLNI